MYIYIDTTERDSFEVALIDEKKIIKKKKVQSERKHSEKLLASIRHILSLSNKALKDVKGVIAVKGPGSFTSLRIGITTANALAFGLNIPVLGIDKIDDLDNIHFQLNKFISKKRGSSIVIPEYGKQPDIQ
jgi:tRNA threonylcarbamoyladenosine biosynthesis protein TsaB